MEQAFLFGPFGRGERLDGSFDFLHRTQSASLTTSRAATKLVGEEFHFRSCAHGGVGSTMLGV